ncbi:MAG TPA: sucrase ferredoxin, partial [Gaiellaceae bacterium]|nr:sucrase ferredoxin [Gaiellaceae bacterium]
MAERRPFCADLSRANGESLAATASRIDRWFLVEYRGLWTSDALAGSGLSDQVKSHLREQARAAGRARVLFVRRPDRRRERGVVAYAADSREGREQLRRFELENHDDLRELDLVASSGGAPVEHPLFVVCTHGKHDPCCARYGRPLYEALRDEVEPDWVWQVTHVGGDRFAGNLVCLPEGVYYGRADRAEAVAILDEHLAGRIWLDGYRGRSCYPFAVQAAELEVRRGTGLTGISDLALAAVRRDGDTWQVTFRAGGEEYEVEVEPELGDFTYLTCNSPAVQRPRHFVATRR